MENAREVRAICDAHGVMMVLDGCRVAENSYFIRHREHDYRNSNYEEIAHEMISLADAFVMSAKKDGMVNMGGLLVLKDPKLARQCINLLIISEGYTTYGGLSGRDMEAMATGLTEVFDPSYLEYRIRSTEYLASHLRDMGVPVVWPSGGHAVYVNAAEFYRNIPVHEYPGQALVCNLYASGGIRCVEVGSVMFGKYNKSGKLIPARQELVRLAIPRRVYTQSHIDYVIDVFAELNQERNLTKGFRITYEPPLLRHFTARFEHV
jgi:tryptophanase